MMQNGYSLIFLLTVIVGAAVVLRWIWRRPVTPSLHAGKGSPGKDAEETIVTARTLMSSEEATLFNMVKLAVQEYYIVLAKIPLLSLIKVEEKDEEAKMNVLRKIRPIRFDVVLLHPGTLKTHKVLDFQRATPANPQLQGRYRLVETLLKAAEIERITLDIERTYSPEEIMELVGLAEDE